MNNCLGVLLILMAISASAFGSERQCSPIAGFKNLLKDLDRKAEGTGVYVAAGGDLGAAAFVGAAACGQVSLEFIKFSGRTHGYCAVGSSIQAFGGLTSLPVVADAQAGAGALKTFGCTAKGYEGKFLDVVFSGSAGVSVAVGAHIGIKDEFHKLFNSVLTSLTQKMILKTVKGSELNIGQMLKDVLEGKSNSTLVFEPAAKNELKTVIEGALDDVYNGLGEPDKKLISEFFLLFVQSVLAEDKQKIIVSWRGFFEKLQNAASNPGLGAGSKFFTGCNSITGDLSLGPGTKLAGASVQFGISNYAKIKQVQYNLIDRVVDAAVAPYPGVNCVRSLCGKRFENAKACAEALSKLNHAPAAADRSQSTKVVP